MPLNFPSNPAVNQIYVYNGIRWRWNGYGWASLGISGGSVVVGGISGDYIAGITGGIGITVSGPTGIVEVTLKLDEPNIGSPYTPPTHNAPTSFSADSGPARKVAFLQEDGSVSFDFIKNYDVFRQSEFNFDILSFNIPGLNPQLVGTQGTNFNLNLFIGNITYNQLASEAQMRATNATIFEQTGFPDSSNFNLNYTIYDFSSSQNLVYRQLQYNNVGTNPDYYRIQLGATGFDSNGTVSYKVKNYDVYFYNYIFYGQSQLTSITSSNFSSLTPVLNGSRAFTINITMSQDNASPYYLYYAYPARLGTATFKDNFTNIEGGFQQQVGTFLYTNPNNYVETYVIWRSEQGNLGTVSISVT